MRIRWRVVCAFISLSAILLVGGSFFDRGVADIQNRQQITAQNQNSESMRWYGTASMEVDKLIEDLGNVVDQYPELFSGVALSYDRQKVNLFLVDPANIEKVPQVKNLVATNGSLVNIKTVKHTMKDLQEARDEAVRVLEGQGLVTAGINVTDNLIELGVESDSKASGIIPLISTDIGADKDLFKVTVVKSADNT